MEEIEDSHSSCKNCELILRRTFLRGGFYCTGIVKRPLKGLEFDVIRLCNLQNESEENVDIIDYAPDEAIATSNLLSASVLEWMQNTQSYLKFRNVE